MSLITMFGINGVGKDTVANEIKKRDQSIQITSMSRLYMYILNISETYDTREKITEEQYARLENIPQETMKNIEKNQYKKFIAELSKSSQKVIFLSHLVSALRLGEEIKYLEDRHIPKWFVEANDILIQLVATPEVISNRRKNDLTRKREIDVNEIIKHQNLCTKEWNRIKLENPCQNMYIVENMDLCNTIDEINRILEKYNRWE